MADCQHLWYNKELWLHDLQKTQEEVGFTNKDVRLWSLVSGSGSKEFQNLNSKNVYQMYIKNGSTVLMLYVMYVVDLVTYCIFPHFSTKYVYCPKCKKKILFSISLKFIFRNMFKYTEFDKYIFVI